MLTPERASGLVGGGSGQPTHPGSTLNQVVPVVSRQTPAPNRSGVGGKSPDLKNIMLTHW
jgi:hypothetical protein